MPEQLTITELGRRWGISRQATGHRVKEPGCPVDTTGKRSVYQWPAVNDWWIDRCTTKALADNAPSDLEEARRRKLSAEAEIAEMERDRIRGELVLVADYQAALEESFTRVRTKLLTFPAYIAPSCAGRLEAEIRAEVERGIHESLLPELRGSEEEPEDKAA